MQLNIKTDYAMWITIYLAELKEITNASEISEALGIPRTYVPKVLKGLLDRGVIASKEGMGGGYYLAKDPREITLLDIYLICEPTIKISRCLEDEACCESHRTGASVMNYYLELQDEIKEKLRNKTIKEFI